jgi:hypothetical protein
MTCVGKDATHVLFLFRPLHPETSVRESKRGRFFLTLYQIHEIAPPTVVELLRIRALDLAAAERTHDRPACPACRLAAMCPVKVLVYRGRTDAEFCCFVASGLTPAFLVLPAIRLPHTPHLSHVQ